MISPARGVTLASVAGAVVLLGTTLWDSTPDEPPAPRSSTGIAPEVDAAAPVAADDHLQVDPGVRSLVSYAVALSDLHGLPPNAAAGTRFELWVAWEPPVTKEPRIHKLLDEVVLEEVSPPLLPDGPHVATLLVRPRQVSDLLYGDRYGSLSVVVRQAEAARSN